MAKHPMRVQCWAEASVLLVLVYHKATANFCRHFALLVLQKGSEDQAPKVLFFDFLHIVHQGNLQHAQVLLQVLEMSQEVTRSNCCRQSGSEWFFRVLFHGGLREGIEEPRIRQPGIV